MNKLAGFVMLLTGCFLSAHAGETDRAAAVKRLAQDMGAWTIKGEYGKLIDLTYDPVVQMLGGREKAISLTETGMEALKSKGIVIKGYQVSDPGEFHAEGNNTFVVVPTRLEMTIPGGKLVTKSFLLAISADDSKTWKFVDGAGIDNPASRDKVLPKLPAKLKLPAKEKPEIFKN